MYLSCLQTITVSHYQSSCVLTTLIMSSLGSELTLKAPSMFRIPRITYKFLCAPPPVALLQFISELTHEAFPSRVCFVSQRRLLTKVYSDNSNNFIGAYHYLEMNNHTIMKASDAIFNRLVASIATLTLLHHLISMGSGKLLWNLLRHTVGEHSGTIVEFTTLFIYIKDGLDSRPPLLTY